jgi:hypothetical protein
MMAVGSQLRIKAAARIGGLGQSFVRRSSDSVALTPKLTAAHLRNLALYLKDDDGQADGCTARAAKLATGANAGPA